MAETIAKLKIAEINGHERLLRELKLNKGTGRTICIIGEAGVSKSHTIQEFGKDFDHYFEVKLAGMSSEDK